MITQNANVSTASSNLYSFKNPIVYPNPSSDIIFLDLGEKMNSNIKIFSSRGDNLLNRSFDEKIIQIDGNQLGMSSGLYYVLIENEFGNSLAKFNFVKK